MDKSGAALLILIDELFSFLSVSACLHVLDFVSFYFTL